MGGQRGWTARVIAVVLVMTGIAPAGALAAQGGAAEATPTFDKLARRVLTLRVQTEGLRGRLESEWQPIAWRDSLNAVRAGIEALKADARGLGAVYRRAGHARGVTLATELGALVDHARDSFNRLARATDARMGRTAVTHLAAGLEAMMQKITEGEACCGAAIHD